MKSNEIEEIIREFSGGRAYQNVENISKWYRLWGSSEYRAATMYIAETLREYGLEVEVESCPLDGKHTIWGYKFPLAWQPKHAELRIVQPVEEKVISFDEIPTCIYPASGCTTAEGVTAELVYIGRGSSDEDYDGRDVRDKVVLVDDPGYVAYRLAVEKYGAAGVVTSYIPEWPPVTREKYPDGVFWTGLNSWSWYEKGYNDRWVISITYRNYKRLRELLEKGAVMVWVKVDTEFFEGKQEHVVGIIKGREKPEEEIVLMAHHCHAKPTAHNGPSGTAILMEMARTISKLIREGRIQPPKRTLKFVSVQEAEAGRVYAYNHKEELKNIVASFYIDLMGRDDNNYYVPISIVRTPNSMRTFLNDYCISFVKNSQAVAQLWPSPTRVAAKPYYPGWDNYIFGDKDVNVPQVGITHGPLLGDYHTQLDNMDNIDPDTLKRNGLIVAMLALTLADAGAEEAMNIMNDVEARSEMRLHAIATHACRQISRALKHRDAGKVGEIVREGENKLGRMLRRNLGDLDSTTVLVEREEESAWKKVNKWRVELRSRLIEEEEREKRRIEGFVESFLMSVPSRKGRAVEEAEKLVPKREFTGPQYLWHIAGLDHRTYKSAVMGPAQLYEVLNFANGERTVADIADEIRDEFEDQYGPICTEDVVDIVKKLEDLGYFSIRR